MAIRENVGNSSIEAISSKTSFGMNNKDSKSGSVTSSDGEPEEISNIKSKQEHDKQLQQAKEVLNEIKEKRQLVIERNTMQKRKATAVNIEVKRPTKRINDGTFTGNTEIAGNTRVVDPIHESMEPIQSIEPIVQSMEPINESTIAKLKPKIPKKTKKPKTMKHELKRVTRKPFATNKPII